MNVKKVFISVGMRGRNSKAVKKDIERAEEWIFDNIYDPCFVGVQTIHNYDCQAPDDAGRLYYLGEAIKQLGDCDICYFVKGWQNHKGCIIEYEVCKQYGIEIIEES